MPWRLAEDRMEYSAAPLGSGFSAMRNGIFQVIKIKESLEEKYHGFFFG
jgi:hypothetical protein